METVAEQLEEVNPPDCPLCGAEQAGVSLGTLGGRQWYRCRDCGIDFNIRVDEAVTS